MPRLALFMIVCLGVGADAAAQTVDQLTKQLESQAGLARAQTLATLTDALRQDNPRLALTYGEQALALFAVHTDPVNQARTLNEMSWAYMTLSDYPNAVAFAEKGRALAEQHGDGRGRARAINNLGVIAQRRGDATEAVEFFLESLRAYRAIGGDLEISTALNNLGFVYSTALADYETGLAYHVEALGLREQIGDKAAIALSLNNIGVIYHRISELDRALSYFERALALRRELGGDNRISGTLSNIGDVYYDKENFARALEYHTQALELRRQIGDRAAIASSLRNIGVTHVARGNAAEARRCLNEALAIATGAGDRSVAAQVHLGLARLDREHGSPHHAIDHARHALGLAEQGGGLELKRLAYEQLAASQEKAGDLAAALKSLKIFQEVNNRIYDADRTRRVELLERRYQAERRETEIAQLHAEKAIAALKFAEQRTQRNTAIVLASLFGLVGIGLYRRRVEAARIAERLSVTDSLTALKNRRYLLQTIDADTATAARKHRMSIGGAAPADGDLVFVLIDIDHFKEINDQFGHECGDKVLVQIADVLRSSCRASDTVVRWGGEEFLVIFRFTNRNTAALSAERIRMAVEQHVFDIGGGRTVRRTCSIGFAPFPLSPERPDAATWEQVVTRADEALYRAKQSGRNTWAGADALHCAS